MKGIDPSVMLRQRIMELQVKQENEAILLKEQFNITYNSLKPSNLAKNLVDEVASSPDIIDNLINTSIGMVTGYVTKKFLLGSTRNPLYKILGTVLEFGLSNVVSKHSEGLRSRAEDFIKTFVKNKIFSTNKTEDPQQL